MPKRRGGSHEPPCGDIEEFFFEKIQLSPREFSVPRRFQAPARHILRVGPRAKTHHIFMAVACFRNASTRFQRPRPADNLLVNSPPSSESDVNRGHSVCTCVCGKPYLFHVKCGMTGMAHKTLFYLEPQLFPKLLRLIPRHPCPKEIHRTPLGECISVIV